MQTTELDWAVGPYKVLERIGGGAAGVVYRARHAQSGQMAAVKTVRIADPLCLRSIRREIRALRTLEHPGIVGVLDEGVAEGLPWYAMPIVEGTTLRDDIDTTLRRRLDSAAGGELPRALNLARKLCESLAYIHDKGLVHKDLKPENVIVRPDGSPVIVDLGLASAFSGWRGRDALEASGRFEGSLGFMAPEQIDGGRVDARADLYSLGCILYEMIALRPVFSAEGWDLIREHQMTVPPAPSTVISGVSAALDDLVMRLLGKRPRDRIGYATDVAVALESIELGVEARSAAARSYLYQPEFAGRGELLKELERALDAAKLVGRQVAIIGGESGAGKTRMAIEIAGLANQAGFRVITGECRPLDCGTSRRDAMLAAPLDPFRPLLQALADESRTAGAAAAEALLGSDAGILSIYEPSLGERRSASALDDLAQLSPQEARHRVTAAVARAVVELSKRRPLFLALDDLQWADDLTVETLAVLIRGSRDSVSLMLVGTYRTEEPREALGPLLSAPGTMHRRLERLDENAVESIVSDMLALPSPPAQLVHYLATQSSGNPFFVAEYLRAAVSKGLLSSDYLGRWQVTARDLTPTQLQDALPLPSSLQELMQNWLAGLPPRSRRLAELASVYGREFEDELLASDDPAEDLSLLDEVEELRRRNVLEDGAAGRVRFTHDKLREIVYEALSSAERRTLHRQAAERIEAKVDPDPSRFGVLAHHWMAAEVDSKAFDALERAGSHALHAGASGAAAGFFQRAIDLAERLAGASESPSADRRASWRCSLGDSWFGLGDVARSREAMERTFAELDMTLPGSTLGWTALLFREAVKQSAHLAGPVAAKGSSKASRERLTIGARAASRLCECYYYRQDLLGVTTAAIMAVNLAERAGRGGAVPRQYAQLGYMAGLLRLHRMADRYFDLCQRGEGPLADPAGAAVALYYRSSYEATFCRWARAGQLADQSVAGLLAVGDQHELQIARTMRAHVDYYTGQFARTLPTLQEVRASAKLRANTQLEAWGDYALARSLMPLGRLAEATVLLEDARRKLEGQADRSSQIICNGLLALARLYTGEREAALRAADTVMELAGQGKPAALTEGRGYEAAAVTYLYLLLSSVGSRADRAFLAGKAKKATALLGQFANLFPLARSASLRCRGLSAWASGGTEQARHILERALRTAQKLDMPYDQALAALELGRLPSRDPRRRDAYTRDAEEQLSSLGADRHFAQLVAMHRASPAAFERNAPA